MRGFTAHILPHIRDVDARDWDTCFPGEVENHAYYSACEKAGAMGHRMAAIAVRDGEKTIAVAPLFEMAYRLDTSLQGVFRPLGQAISKMFPRLTRLDVLGMGSPYAERCHLGFLPGLLAEEKRAALDAMLSMMMIHAGQNETSIVAIKDLDPVMESEVGPVLAAKGLTRAGSLPIAALNVVWKSEDDYIAHLSPAMRKDLRRKLRQAKDVRIELTHDICPYADEIESLYASTRHKSGVDYGDFEMLPENYFASISQALKERAVFILLWVGETLAGFNLLLIEDDRIIDKFVGMRYPLATEHNLYFVRWMECVRYCLRNGQRVMQAGQTAYHLKVRLGSSLIPSAIYFKHRSKLVHAVLRKLSPYVAFDRLDPELRALRAVDAAKALS